MEDRQFRYRYKDTKILWGRVRHGVGEKKNKTQENNKSCPKVKLEV